MIYNNGTRRLDDLLDVGECIEGRGVKMVGYKTLRDLRVMCHLDADGIGVLQGAIERRGNMVLTLGKEEGSTEPWAVYAYAPSLLIPYLKSQSSILAQNQWPDKAEGFVRRLAVDWVPWGTPLRKVIDTAFGNFDHEKSRPDIVDPSIPHGVTGSWGASRHR
ncbi:hypothetical protein [Hyphomicrobium zavarzinii]|uniref:hypothetical protein n=1 Tax=Hyphomicrobium zavarzinii TaxID=48292 RepID=UPI00036544EE|nr:hypothetical protein [Hyphomicrobium zavarzinii]